MKISTCLLCCLLWMFLSCGSRETESNRESSKTNLTETGQYFISQGDSLYVRTIGAGPPILFIHGGPGLNHDYFLPHMRALSDHYRLIFYDQRAAGRSSADVDSTTISLQGFLTDIENIRSQLELDLWSVVGHSWGGLLAMHYALAHEDKIDALILVGSAPPSTELQNAVEKEMQNRETSDYRDARNEIVSSEAFRNGEASAYESLFRLIFSHQFYDPSYTDSLILNLPPDFAERGRKLRFLSRDFSEFDLHSDLETLQIPVLILYGNADPLTDITAPELAKYISDSELIIIQESGHFPFIESKTSFFRSLRAFLENSPDI